MRNIESIVDLQINWVTRYLDCLRLEKRQSPHSVSAAARDLAVLGECPEGQDTEQLKRILAQKHASGLAPASLARMASSWRGFFKFLVEQGQVELDPSLGLKTPKLPKRLPKALSVDQAGALLRDPMPEIHSHALAHVLIELLYATGLRISEALSLQCASNHGSGEAWISLSRAELQVQGKGGKARVVPLTPHFIQVAQLWLQRRQALLEQLGAPPAINAFLIDKKGKPYTVRQAQKDVRAYAQLKGLNQALHPHMLRHSFASHVLQGSQNLRAVQELLGHASIASTQVYTTLDFKHLAAVYDDAFPRAKSK